VAFFLYNVALSTLLLEAGINAAKQKESLVFEVEARETREAETSNVESIEELPAMISLKLIHLSGVSLEVGTCHKHNQAQTVCVAGDNYGRPEQRLR
jgi:hypothetical protein